MSKKCRLESRPIEGVSTSTAGMVGVTERGPEGQPVLVTSYPDFRRHFGAELNHTDFTVGGRGHGFLPDAVEGFFNNNGRRLYVVRAISEDAAAASRVLYDQDAEEGTDAAVGRRLLRRAAQDTGTALSGPGVVVLDGAGLADQDWVRIGGGARSEYRRIDGAPVASEMTAVGFPLADSHAVGTPVDAVARVVDPGYGGAFSTTAAMAPGDTSITVVPAIAADEAVLTGALPQVMEIGTAPQTEYHLVTDAAALGGGALRLTFAQPVRLERAPGAAVVPLDVGTALDTSPLRVAANAGDNLVFVDSAGPGFVPGNLLVLQPAGAAVEVLPVGTLGALSLGVGSYSAYPAGTRVMLSGVADQGVAVNDAAATPASFVVSSAAGLTLGEQILVAGEASRITGIDAATDTITLAPALPAAPNNGDAVVPFATLTATAARGRRQIALDSRVGLIPGGVVRLGEGDQSEYLGIANVPGPRGPGLDPGNVVLTVALRRSHNTGTPLRRQDDADSDDATRQAAFVTLAVPEDDNQSAPDGGGANPLRCGRRQLCRQPR